MKNNYKKGAVFALAALSITCMAWGAWSVISVPRSTARADKNENLVMLKGASLYLNEVSGLRFGYTIEDYEEADNKNYGMLIVPKDYLDKAEIAIDAQVDYVTALNAAKEAGKINYLPIVAENLIPKQDGDTWVVSHSIVDLSASNYVREFFGIGFEKTGDTYTYAISNDNVRSVFEVTGIALNEYQSGTMSEEEKVLFEKKREVTQNFIEKGFDFVYSDVAIKNSYVGAESYKAIELIKQAGKEKIDLSSQLRVSYSSSDESVAEIAQDGTITPKAYGTTEITLSIAGAKEIKKSVKVLANKAQATLSVSSNENVDFTQAGEIILPSAQLSGDDSTRGNARTLGIFKSEYVALEGNYGAGTAFDVEFKGNNMPILKVLADKINTRLGQNDGNGNNDGDDAGIAALIFNGTSYDAGQVLNDEHQPFIIGENIYLSAGPMAHGYRGTKGFMNYGSAIPQFLQASLKENPETEYKITVALSESNGAKIIELFFYQKADTEWSYINSISCPLTQLGKTYGTNVVIMPGFNGAENTTFKVSEPRAYEKTDNVYTTGLGENYAKNADGTYTFTLKRLYDKEAHFAAIAEPAYGYNAYTSGANYIAFSGEYGIGTYVDIETTGNVTAENPYFNIQLFAQRMKGEWNSSGVLYTVFKPKTSTSFNMTSQVYYGQEGILEATKVWDLANESGKDKNGKDATAQSLLQDASKLGTNGTARVTIGTYVGENGNVFIEMKISYVAASGTVYERCAIKKDTGVLEADWFKAGGIVITPAATRNAPTSSTASNEFKCRIYDANEKAV